MCLEDLKLGKGRFAQKPGIVGGPASLAVLLPADPRRVAVLISVEGLSLTSQVDGSTTYDTARIYLTAASETFIAAALVVGSPPLLMRIEDFGPLVTNEIRVDLTDISGLGLNNAYAVPVCSNVEAKPIATGHP